MKVLLFECKGDIRKSGSQVGRSINLTLSTRGLEALKAVGYEEQVLYHSVSVYGRMIHSLDGEASSQEYSAEGKAIYSIDRMKLNQLLLDAAEAHSNVTLCFEHKLLHTNLKKQLLTFRTPEGKKELTFGWFHVWV